MDDGTVLLPLFVDPPPAYLHLKCPICLETLLPEPCLLSCCGNHFCKNCVKQLQRKPCPLCKAEERNHSRVPDKGQQRALNSIMVYCPNKEKSCEWAGEFGTLQNHLSKSCAFVLIMCKFKCGSLVARRNLMLHESEKCPYRPATCRHCKTYSSSHAMVLKHESQCPKEEVSCPYSCGAPPFLREAQSQHMETCSMIPTNCTFAYAGCKWRGPKATLDSHCHHEIWKQHMSLIVSHTTQEFIQKQDKKILALLDEVDKQGVAIEGLTKDIEILEQLYSIKPTLTNTSSHHSLYSLPPILPRKQTFKFVVNRYNYRRTENSSVFHSPQFNYSGKCYMQLNVYLNGNDEGKRSHISIYATLSAGCLPSCGSLLAVRLCCQNQSCDHYEKIITFDTSNKKHGLATFINHNSVSLYLKNDSLLFELPQIIV